MKSVVPWSRMLRSWSRSSMMPSGSRPLVGSSRIMSSGSGRSAIARPRRCFQGVLTHRVTRPAVESDDLEHVIDPGAGLTTKLGQHLQVLASAQTGIEDGGLADRAD